MSKEYWGNMEEASQVFRPDLREHQPRLDDELVKTNDEERIGHDFRFFALEMVVHCDLLCGSDFLVEQRDFLVCATRVAVLVARE